MERGRGGDGGQVTAGVGSGVVPVPTHSSARLSTVSLTLSLCSPSAAVHGTVQ